MSKLISSSLFRSAAKRVRGFRAQKEGVAAVEFALILPLMAALFMGVVEISEAVTANRRVSQVGSTAGDLVARASGNIYNLPAPVVVNGESQITIDDIMQVSSWLMLPFKTDASNRLQVEISVVSSSASSNTDTKQKWYCKYDTAASLTAVTCTCPNSAYTLPNTGMLTTSDSVVVAKVQYGYRPAMFNFAGAKIMGAQLGGYMASSNGGTPSAFYNMTETVYLKPRAVCPTLTKSDGTTTCGC